MQTCCANYATALTKSLAKAAATAAAAPGCAQRREAERRQCCRSVQPSLLLRNLILISALRFATAIDIPGHVPSA
jgi:hypothetical protein